MKYRTPLLTALLSTGLLFTGIALAQDPPMQPANPSSLSNTAPPAAGADSLTFNSSQGQVTIDSTMGKTPSTASPPSFEQLASGSKFITREQAKAFPPLANDFDYASGYANRISRTQYQRWLQNLN